MDRRNAAGRLMLCLAFCLLLLLTASAHVGQGDVSGGFVAGFMHPIFGLDHVVAMVAVGLWGAQLGQPAIWVLPVTFPIVMAFGGVLGGMGIALPGVEFGIAGSAIALGAMVLFAVRPPLWMAGVLVGIFAIFHGHAHGVELPASADPISYSAGFVIATGGLHLVGILIGNITRWKSGNYVLRAAGAAIAAVGIHFLSAAFSG